MHKRIIFSLLIALLFLGIVYAGGFNKTIAAYAMRQGDYYFNGGAYDLTKAQSYYEWAIRFDPEIPLAHYRLADVYFIQRKEESALKHINVEIARNPEFGRAYYVRGLIYGFNGKLDEAEQDFKTLLSLRPAEDTAWAIYNDLAWIQFQKGNFADVEKTAREGLTRFPSNPWLLNSLGLALLNSQKKEEAQIVFGEAVMHIEKLTLEDVRKAYPGNDPATAGQRREKMINTIKYNSTLAQG